MNNINTSVYDVWRDTRNISEVIEFQVNAYENNIKGYILMIEQENKSNYNEEIKKRNIEILNKDLKKAKRNLSILLKEVSRIHGN